MLFPPPFSLLAEKEALEKMVQDEADSSEYAILAKKELEDVLLAMQAKQKELEEMNLQSLQY